jgi:hypothetical protein
MKINIGITIKLSDPKNDSMFSNGIRQNVVLLQEMYEKCKNVNKSYIINTSDIDPDLYKGTTWEKYSHLIINSEQTKDLCDIVVICHGNTSLKKYKEYKELGKKIVVQVLGSELCNFNECILFKPEPSNIYKENPFVTTVWTSPHFYDRDRFFFEARYNCPVYEAPYIWDPRFIEEHVKTLTKPDKPILYTPKSEKKRISVVEPNINMVKTCTIPIVISELFFRKNPDLVQKISLFGAKKLSDKKDMVDFAISLKSYKAKKLFFESRYPIVWTLSSHTDILLSHQNECELNYAYLDAAWLGYPVVHNSPMMKELGWYYPENNATIAAEHLLYIARNFDSIDYPNDKYLNQSRKFAYRYMIDNPKNIEGYEILIDKALKEA